MSDQCHLKKPIIHIYIFASKIFKSSNRSGICNHSYDKIIFYLNLFRGYFHMIGFDIEQSFYPFQKVCHMSKNIFQILVCFIGYICKQTKSSHICKRLAVKSSYITVIQFFFHDHLSSLHHAFGHKETVCKIIGTSCRNISNRYITVFLCDSGNYLIQCTVSSAAHDQINRVRIFFCFFICIFRCLCCADNDLIIMTAEYINNIQ